MSYTLTPEGLQNISVRVVSKFMRKEASLNEAVACEAKALELNPEQIKRVIEASNSVAYLRQLQDAQDRTFEFPTADYNQVLGQMCGGAGCGGDGPVELKMVEKQATDPSPFYGVDYGFLSEHEKLVALSRELVKVAALATRLDMDALVKKEQLQKAAALFSKEPHAYEKLVEVCNEDNFEKTAALTGIEKKASVARVLFQDKDLTSARSLLGLLKQAEELVTEQRRVTAQCAKAAGILKSAGTLGNLFGLKGPKLVNGSVTSTIMDKGVAPAVGWVSDKIGGGLGWAAGKLGKGVGHVASSAGSAAARGVSISKPLPGAKAPFAGKGMRLGGSVLTVSMGAMPSHTPDVWDSLH